MLFSFLRLSFWVGLPGLLWTLRRTEKDARNIPQIVEGAPWYSIEHPANPQPRKRCEPMSNAAMSDFIAVHQFACVYGPLA